MEPVIEPVKEPKKFEVTVPMAIVVGALIIAVAIIIAFGPRRASTADDFSEQDIVAMVESITETKGPLPVPAVTEADHVRGAKNPVLTIIEYSDFECPYCKNFHETMEQVLKKYGNKVAWVYRHFPLDCEDNESTQCRVLHENARVEAMASECVARLGGNDAFWKYADAIFSETKSNDGLALERLPVLASAVGVSAEEFTQCLDTKATAGDVSADAKPAIAAKVTGTPTSYIVDSEGVSYTISGGYPFEAVDAVLEDLLK